MALETATYISDLVSANPLGSDPIAYADDHIRLIKATLQATFPNIKGAVTVSQERLNNSTPVGLIAMWSGTTLPAGWTLCNGVAVARSDGTGNITPPDLRDRFLVGSGGNYPLGNIGGVASYQLTTAQLPSHTHGVNENPHGHGVNENPHSHGMNGFYENIPGNQVGGGGTPINSVGNSTSPATTGISIAAGVTGISIQATGGNAPIENRPPFYALAFIMKV